MSDQGAKGSIVKNAVMATAAFAVVCGIGFATLYESPRDELFDAAANGDAEDVYEALERFGGFEGEDKIAWGSTALIEAFTNNNLTTFQWLLASEAGDQEIREHLLSMAAQDGKVQYVSSLIENGVNPNGSDGSPLMLAAQNGQVEAAFSLLDAGADPNVMNGAPLVKSTGNFAARSGDRIARLLVDHGADINLCQSQAFRHAVSNGRTHIVHYLIEAGVDVNAADGEPLILAASRGFDDIVDRLIKAGADVEAQNNQALRIALAKGKSSAVLKLVAAGADLSLINQQDLQQTSGYLTPSGCGLN